MSHVKLLWTVLRGELKHVQKLYDVAECRFCCGNRNSDNVHDMTQGAGLISKRYASQFQLKRKGYDFMT